MMLTEEERAFVDRLESESPSCQLSFADARRMYAMLRRLADVPVRGDVLTDMDKEVMHRWAAHYCGDSDSVPLPLIAIIDRLAALPMPVATKWDGTKWVNPTEEETRKDERERCVAELDALYAKNKEIYGGITNEMRGMKASITTIQNPHPDKPAADPPREEEALPDPDQYLRYVANDEETENGSSWREGLTRDQILSVAQAGYLRRVAVALEEGKKCPDQPDKPAADEPSEEEDPGPSGVNLTNLYLSRIDKKLRRLCIALEKVGGE